MVYRYDVNNKREMKKLCNSKRFPKYPTMFLSKTCQVRVNSDDCLKSDNFTVYCKSRILPRKIFLFGKKTRTDEENDIFLNYWLGVFFSTIEEGILHKYDFNKSDTKLELCIGLPLKYRTKAFKYKNWTRENVREFLECLFNCELEEADYEQQDLLDNIMVA